MDKHKAIQTIQEALEQSPASDNSSEEEFTTVLKWLGDISMTVLQGAVHSKGLTKVEGETLARFLEFWDVNSIKDQVIPLIEQSSTSCKLGFVNWLLAPIDEPTTTAVQKRRSRDGDGAPPQPQPAKLSLETKQHLTKPLLSNIWSDFRLKAPPWPKAPPSTYRSVKSISHWSVTENQEDRSSRFVNGGDLRQLINHTVSAGAVSESEIKDRLSKAVRTADKETYVHALLPFVEEILAQKVSCYNNKHGGEIDTETGELSQQSMEFVTHLLLNDLKTCVGKEPRGQVKWSQPRRGCGCRDCLGVDAFLASPTESVGRFPCAKPRRQHLHQQFNRSPNTPYTIETTHNSNPHVWQITKKNKQLERQAVWRKDRDEARSWLAWLQNAVRNPNRPLRDYLGTMADAILAADYDRVAQEHEAALARLDATVGGDEERRQDLDAPVGGDEEPRQDGLSLSSPRRPLVPSTSTSNVPSGGERSGSKRPADAGGDARAKKSRTGSSKRGESESEFTMTENGAVEVIDLT
ncbi:hypothetical protein A1O3_00315 [Capronia epimyces CBS 606.96]|uniref:Uncharacterized protein n=1 Tax=Capronia epimyces CBS 606.96 TaxID=1182542 RepID=W9YQ14_9EURO|nr:uncharacterized protein A1O3_00315 [Capronia epimyces CBS 606.96]EXJ91765.1 hypothetical protein A1O3_00315 [Capronia epimyces CBS 606.96]